MEVPQAPPGRYCLFCPNPLNHTGGNTPVAAATALGLKGMFQYLRFDISQSPSVPAYYISSRGSENDGVIPTPAAGEPMKLLEVLGNSLCLRCDGVAICFGHFYGTLGQDSHLLAGCVQLITNRLTTALENQGRGGVQRKKCEVELRAEILALCQTKLQEMDSIDCNLAQLGLLTERALDVYQRHNMGMEPMEKGQKRSGESREAPVGPAAAGVDESQGGGGGGDMMEVNQYHAEMEQEQKVFVVSKEDEEEDVELQVMEGLVPCQFCPHRSYDRDDHVSHLLSHHEPQFWADKLPPGTGTSLQEVRSKLGKLKQEWVEIDEDGGSKCSICRNNILLAGGGDDEEWNAHVVKAHLDFVVHQLIQDEEEVVDVEDEEEKENEETAAAAANINPVSTTPNATKMMMCPYCGIQSGSAADHKYHMTCVHTTQHFGESLPPGATAHWVSTVIKQLINEGQMITSVGKGRHKFRCHLCGGGGGRGGSIVRDRSMKYHLLDRHLETVAKKLEDLGPLI